MQKEKMSLELWDDMPEDMKKYLKNYGFHFTGKIYRFAVSKMFKETKEGKKEKIQPVERDTVMELLKKYNITLDNDEMYDSAYVYSSAMADYYGQSIPNEQYLAMFIKNRIDDADKKSGYIFHQWYFDMVFDGTPIDWEEFV